MYQLKATVLKNGKKKRYNMFAGNLLQSMAATIIADTGLIELHIVKTTVDVLPDGFAPTQQEQEATGKKDK